MAILELSSSDSSHLSFTYRLMNKATTSEVGSVRLSHKILVHSWDLHNDILGSVGHTLTS
jgi:hypothetical protein